MCMLKIPDIDDKFLVMLGNKVAFHTCINTLHVLYVFNNVHLLIGLLKVCLS